MGGQIMKNVQKISSNEMESQDEVDNSTAHLDKDMATRSGLVSVLGNLGTVLYYTMGFLHPTSVFSFFTRLLQHLENLTSDQELSSADDIETATLHPSSDSAPCESYLLESQSSRMRSLSLPCDCRMRLVQSWSVAVIAVRLSQAASAVMQHLMDEWVPAPVIPPTSSPYPSTKSLESVVPRSIPDPVIGHRLVYNIQSVLIDEYFKGSPSSAWSSDIISSVPSDRPPTMPSRRLGIGINYEWLTSVHPTQYFHLVQVRFNWIHKLKVQVHHHNPAGASSQLHTRYPLRSPPLNYSVASNPSILILDLTCIATGGSLSESSQTLQMLVNPWGLIVTFWTCDISVEDASSEFPVEMNFLFLNSFSSQLLPSPHRS
uniref:Uncharacterized protein n=1 Tax=Timema poppense TaxID=170557 RepID=A0A7R9CKH8_TIMPO|nr:unnamed protein product [Timema poppensis]